MTFHVPAYPMLTSTGPMFSFAVNNMGNMQDKDLYKQFQDTMTPATSAAKYAEQQARAASSAAVVMALTPDAPATVPEQDIQRMTALAAAEAERQRQQRRKRTNAMLVVGAILAYAALAGGD
jgi:hypothetical protein